MLSKICGIKDPTTLDYLINHKYPPQFIGFICNYKKSKRYIKFDNLVKLVNANKKGIFFVAVLVNPDESFLEKIKGLNFDYYQLYNVSPERTKIIKNKYNKKIISALTINKKSDVNKYISYKNFSDIILFDGKGYEKSIGFDHLLVKNLPSTIKKMLAGNIRYNEKLDNYAKIADIIDISGSLETSGKKDLAKIDIFLQNLRNLND
ncbi:MAG: phosphoribosylanthranilate isomerase [Pelagibacterales bacterium]|nr:phosphoribosylanthranilate isomerase [Pelagibacterales bacterium]